MKNDIIISWEQIKDISYNLEASYLTISCLIPLGIVRMMSLRGLGVVVCTVAKDPKSLSTRAEAYELACSPYKGIATSANSQPAKGENIIIFPACVRERERPVATILY